MGLAGRGLRESAAGITFIFGTPFQRGVEPEDTLRLTFLKDAILAVYQSRAMLWQTLQGAAIAALPISGVAALAGQLPMRLLGTVLGLEVAVAVVCGLAMVVNQRIMERDLRNVLDEIKRVKPARGG